MTYITEKEEINNLISGFDTIRMYRAAFGGKRGYILPEPFTIFSGLTGALSAAGFKGHIESKRLQKWRDMRADQMGSTERAEAYLNSMADFGSICHMAIVTIHKQGKLTWKDEEDYATGFFIESAQKLNIPVNMDVVRQQVFEYCKCAAAILQFVYDNVTTLHAVEGMAYSAELGIATPVDIVCTLKTGKKATINLKTSSQISGHQREQVAIEKLLWNLTYPALQAEQTGILRPKDWSLKKGQPTYEFELLKPDEEQQIRDNALARLRLCKSDPNSTYLTVPASIGSFEGETKAGELPKVIYKTMEQLWKEEQQ